MGGKARRCRARLVVPLLAMLLTAACSADRAGGRPAVEPTRTIAFLRAVRSSQPQNQAAFLEELAGGGLRQGDGLVLLAKDLDEVHPDAASSEAAVRRWAGQDVDLIVALSTVGARAAATAAPDVNVLFLVNDPVAAALVRDPRQPSGNLTGVTFRVPADRTLDLARQALPGVEKFGVVYAPGDPAAAALAEEAAAAAATLGIELTSATFTGLDDAGAAVDTVRAEGARAVWVLNSPTSLRSIEPIVAVSTAASLPLITNTTVGAAVVTLQPDTVELYRQMARQALRLFDGDPVVDIPVENPSKFVVEVNLAAAERIGISVPESLVVQADRVTR